MKYNLNHHQQLCDFLTPVQTYLLLRDEGHSSVLFESTDYHSREDAHSVVAFDPQETLKHPRTVEAQGYAEAIQTFLSGIECAEATDKDGFLGSTAAQTLKRFVAWTRTVVHILRSS